MISIFCNGYWLDMPPDSSIRTEAVSSLFQTDLFEGSYSFPFDLPWTPSNMRSLGFPTVIEVIDRPKEWQVQLYYSGVKLYDCKLTLQKATRLSITVNLVTGLAGLEVLDKKLPEFNLGGDRYIGPDAPNMVAHANSLVTQLWPQIDYVFAPHWNPDFYGESNTAFQQVVNRWDMNAQTFLMNDLPAPINQNCLVPFVFAAYILKQCFFEIGLSVDGDFFTDPELSQMLVYNNYALDGSNEDYNCRVSTVTPHDLLPSNGYIVQYDNDTTPPNNDVGNLFDTALHRYDITAAAIFTITVHLVVGFSSSTMHNTIEVKLINDAGTQLAYFGVQTNESSGTTIHETRTYTATLGDIGDHFYIKATAFDDPGYELYLTVYSSWLEIKGQTNINRYSTSINLQNHVPAITFGDYLQALRNSENLSFSINRISQTISINRTAVTLKKTPSQKENFTGQISREYEIQYEDNGGYTFNYSFPTTDELVQDNFKEFNSGQRIDDVINFGALPSPAGDIQGKIILVLNTNKFYIAKTDPFLVPYWEFHSDNHYPLVIGNGQNAVTPACSPLFMTTFANVGGHALMPAVRQKGQSKFFSNGESEFTDLRFVIWRGMQPGNGGDLYPLASSTRHDFAGTELGLRSLRWDGSDGVYVYSWEQWIAVLMRGQFVRRFLNLDILHLTNLTEEKKRIGNIGFLFRRVSTSWGKSIEPSEVEMYQV
jgi:hypothetical protein